MTDAPNTLRIAIAQLNPTVGDIAANIEKAREARADAARHAHTLMRGAEVALLQPLLDYVSAKNSVRLVGPANAARRAPTVALAIEGDPEEAAAALAPHGVMAGGGDFYAQRPLQAVGVDPAQGVLRLSFVHYTEKAEVDALMVALDQVL